ncbi:CHAT domain-containing protein [Runella sp.]|uniref:CHAT domain-containing protein n=1 Tax=Runella sp. TaxID=1960881 RepID=UPI00261AC46A|nr:CHAT domain-containing protein [Runella sp.]
MRFSLRSIVGMYLWSISFGAIGQQTPTSKADYHQKKAEHFSQLDSSRLAIIHYQKAYQLVSRIDNNRAADLCVDICSEYYKIGDFKSAISICQKGLYHLRFLSTLSDTTHFKLYSFLGPLHQQQSNTDSSYFYFQQAEQTLERNISIETRLPTYVLYHYNNQGRMLLNFQDYKRSMVYFQKARAMAIKYGMKETILYVSSSIAECYDLLEDHQQALQYRRETLRLHTQPDLDRAAYLSGLAWTFYKLGRYAASLATSQNTLRLLEKIHPENTTAYFTILLKQYWFMGACFYDQQKYQEADRNVNQALGIYQANFTVKSENLASLYLLKAQIALQKQDYIQALKSLDKVLQVALIKSKTDSLTVSDIKNPKLSVLAAQYKAWAWQRKYQNSHLISDLSEATNAYELAMHLQQLTGKSIEDKQMRLLLSEQKFSLYPEAIRMGYEAHRRNPRHFGITRLFRWFEAFQANHLNDAVRVTMAKKRTLPPHILDEEMRIERQLMAFRGKQSIDTIIYNDLQIRGYRFKQNLLAHYPAYYRSIYQAAHFSLPELQQTLNNQTAYLSYIWQNDCLYTMVITRDKAEVICQPIPKRLAYCLKDLQQQLSYNPGLGRYTGTESAVYCYQYLVETLKKQLVGKQSLVISRDPKFQFLPFEVLETGQKRHDYMLGKFAIAYTYSAQWYWQHPAKSKINNETWLEKLFPNLRKNTLVITPFVAEKQLDSHWKPVSNLKEIKKIGGEALLTTKATKTALLNTDLQKKVIHIATHAFVDSVDSFNSYLQLYPDHDSHLYFDDICHLPLQNTALVVLGACEADKGNIVQGEGVLSLARAFAYAGAQAVVTTSWEANNDAISFLSSGLHLYLQQGYPIDKAIQQVRLDLLNSEEYTQYKHPYYWANYTLLGNHDAIYPNKFIFFKPFKIWIVGIILLIVASTLWIKRQKITLWVLSSRTTTKPIK